MLFFHSENPSRSVLATFIIGSFNRVLFFSGHVSACKNFQMSTSKQVYLLRGLYLLNYLLPANAYTYLLAPFCLKYT